MPKYKIDYNATLKFQEEFSKSILNYCDTEESSCSNCKYNLACMFNLKFTTILLKYKYGGLF